MLCHKMLIIIKFNCNYFKVIPFIAPVNKVIIFVFFANKKYSRSFVKLRLNHRWHMDYFNDVLYVSGPWLSVDILAAYALVRELLEFIKNILICVSNMNENLTCLERHEGE